MYKYVENLPVNILSNTQCINFTLITCCVTSVNYWHITCSLSLQSSLLSAAAACAQPHGSGEVTLHLQAPSTASWSIKSYYELLTVHGNISFVSTWKVRQCIYYILERYIIKHIPDATSLFYCSAMSLQSNSKTNCNINIHSPKKKRIAWNISEFWFEIKYSFTSVELYSL